VYEWGTLLPCETGSGRIGTYTRSSTLFNANSQGRWDRDRENAVGGKACASRLWTPFIANREYTGRYEASTLRRIRSYTFARDRHLPRQHSEVWGIWEQRSCAVAHLRPEPPFNVSGREWDISLLLLARDSSGSIIYGRIFKHRDHTCACFMCRTRPLKILLSGDDFFDSDSPLLMSASTAIDSIHNTRRKGKHEGRKSMNNKSLRNYSIIIMKYVIFKVDVTYHESFISIVF